MRTILQLGLGLAFLTSPALGQSPNPLANSRIVDVSPAATGIRAYQPPRWNASIDSELCKSVRIHRQQVINFIPYR
jgi:hypothetical protein